MHVDGSVEHEGDPPAEIVLDDPTSVSAPAPALEVAEDPPQEDAPVDDDGTLVAVAHNDPSGPPLVFEDDNVPSDFEPQKTHVLDEAPQEQPGADATVASYEITDDEPTVYNPPGATPDSPDLSDIARFGNSEDARTSDGSLRYTVFVTGIDTADVREAFREAITDRKLVWDIDQILRSLKNGEVAIENVTPPKAYILITRLRNLPVNVRWEQYAISQT